ncbi:MAG: ABC-type transporter ATP-binding protein [Hyphomicrobiales bacterium]|jgi:NitT/TauT family transport system ATP-binding protein|nr:ABC-type transporter ATP-binding protein [Hyphomicrobiales bacterium]
MLSEGPQPETSEACAIVTRKAGKTYLEGDVVAFQDLELSVRKQEILCIVGPSGCGKTTLLRAIAGLTQLTSGSIEVQGKTVKGPPEGVATVFQHFGLLPWKTVFENAAFGLRVQRTPAAQIRDRVSRYLEVVGLTRFADSYPYQLSGGMQQRVGLARALAIDPSILLMDEPFAALDAQTREILQEELVTLMQRPGERKAMVFITHSIDEALIMGDRIAVMSARPGRVIEMIDVPFSWPRDVEEIRASPVFADLRRHIWGLLRNPNQRSNRSSEIA